MAAVVTNKQAEEFFKCLDQDGNGYLNLKEFRDFLLSQGKFTDDQVTVSVVYIPSVYSKTSGGSIQMFHPQIIIAFHMIIVTALIHLFKYSLCLIDKIFVVNYNCEWSHYVLILIP